MTDGEKTAQPVQDADRIASLDVLRGFALLGILLLNVLGFGLASAAYSNPAVDLRDAGPADVAVWATVELLAEGSMRCLFSILFGAGVVLFATGARAKSGVLHYRRTFWLLCFGLFDAYVLLWPGDILVTYAVAGAFLYLLRNVRPSRLAGLAAVLLLVLSLFYGGFRWGMGFSAAAAQEVATRNADELPQGTLAAAQGWEDFRKDFDPPAESIEAELVERRASYRSAAEWNEGKATEMIVFIMPFFLLWDALVMMLLGMALFKWGVLQGKIPQRTCWWLVGGGFAVGLAVNAFEVSGALRSNFDLFSVFAQMQPTYHFGRLGVALGYLGLILLWVRTDALAGLQRRLASVGRMALTNYLLHSLCALFLFTGAGLGLVGELSRAQLYPIVLGIWIVQLLGSDLWLRRFRFGPVEWFWRFLTYGKAPAMRRLP